MIAAIDIGSGYVKAISSNDRDPVSFLSQVGVVPDGTLNQYGMEDIKTVDYLGKTWVTGADAGRILPEHKQANTLDFGWSGSDGWMVLMLRALANMGIVSGSHRLVVGVPQRIYSEKRNEIIAKIVGRHVATIDGHPFDVTIVDGSPTVMPQAAAALYRLLEQDSALYGHMLGSVDVGTYTTGFAVMEGSNFIPYLSGGVEIGMSSVAKVLGGLIHEKYGAHPTMVNLMRAVSERQMYLNGAVVDLSKSVEDAAEEVVGPLVTQLRGLWEKQAASMIVAVVGGGAPLFKEAIKRAFPYADAPPAEKGRFYPVMGMFAALRTSILAGRGV